MSPNGALVPLGDFPSIRHHRICSLSPGWVYRVHGTYQLAYTHPSTASIAGYTPVGLHPSIHSLDCRVHTSWPTPIHLQPRLQGTHQLAYTHPYTASIAGYTPVGLHPSIHSLDCRVHTSWPTPNHPQPQLQGTHQVVYTHPSTAPIAGYTPVAYTHPSTAPIAGYTPVGLHSSIYSPNCRVHTSWPTPNHPQPGLLCTYQLDYTHPSTASIAGYTPVGLHNKGALHAVAYVYAVLHVINQLDVPPKTIASHIQQLMQMSSYPYEQLN